MDILRWYYYGFSSGMEIFPTCFIIGYSISIIAGLTFFITESWCGGRFSTMDDQFNPAFLCFQTSMMILFGGLFIGMVLPFAIIFGCVWGVSILLNRWGSNYRELEKTKEENRLNALKELFKDDPVMQRKYQEIMRETPEI